MATSQPQNVGGAGSKHIILTALDDYIGMRSISGPRPVARLP